MAATMLRGKNQSAQPHWREEMSNQATYWDYAAAIFGSGYFDSPVRQLNQDVSLYNLEHPGPPARYECTPFCVCFVGSGSGQARVARAFEPCGPGEHIVKAWAREFETEIVEASPDEPFRSLMIQFSSEEIESAFKEIGSCLPASSRLPSGYKSLWAPTARVSRTDADFMATVANYFSSLVSDDIIPRRLLLPLRRREVLYRLLLPLIQQKVDDEINFTGIVAGAKNRAGSFDLQPVLDLMAENLAEPLSVAELAERVHMSPSRFAHVFAEQAGISPQQMRKRLRLHRARVLLDREGWSVSAAAGEVGYSNDSHFIREFKRFFGTTPGRYTKEIASA